MNTAQTLQIIHQIDDDLAAAAKPFIDAFKANSPQGMAWTKALLSHLENGEINQQTRDHTSERIARIRVSEEGQEGLNAFFEKRAPQWQAEE